MKSALVPSPGQGGGPRSRSPRTRFGPRDRVAASRPVELGHSEEHSDPRHPRSHGRPIINKFNGEPFHIALARPTGSFEFTYGEIGRGTTAVTGDLEMAFEDSWALFCVHHYNQDGLIR